MKLRLPGALASLDEPDNLALGEALRFGEALGVLKFVEQDGGDAVEVDHPAWARLGAHPDHISDVDEKDDALDLVEILERTFSRGVEPIQLRLKGLLSQPRSDIVVRIGSEEVHLDGAWPTNGGRALSMGPILAAALRAVVDYRDASDDDARRAAVIRLNRYARAHRRAMNGEPVLDLAPNVTLDRASRVRTLHLRVADALNEPSRVSVIAEVVDDEGRSVPVTPATHRPKSGIVEAPSRHLIELGESHRRALEEIERLKAVPRATLEGRGALEEPQRLLSPETLAGAGDSIEFHGYSERVIEFREARPGEVQRAPGGSALEWWSDEGGSELFHLIHQRDSAGAGLPAIPVPTREGGEQLKALCADALAAGARGQPVPPVMVNGVTLRDVPAVYKDLERRLERADGVEDAKADPSGPSKVRGRPLVAELRDAEPASAAAGTGPHEPPWERLRAVLAAGFEVMDHQRDGIRWLWTRYQQARASVPAHGGALLADDMGLGKTFQIAAVMALATGLAEAEGARRPHLVVAPKILLHNWRRELEAYFRPRTLAARVVEGHEFKIGSGTVVEPSGDIRQRSLAESDVWITNYDTVQSYGPALAKVGWGLVVLDEAQAIKNPNTAASRNVRALKKTFGIVSTGTPVENVLADVFPLADFAFPGVLGPSPRSFAARFPPSEDRSIAEVRKLLRFGDGEQALVLRREKLSVLAHKLPPKLTEVVPVEMSGEQRELEGQLVRVGQATPSGRLELLSSLQKLYQHPQLLYPSAETILRDAEQLCRESPKLAWLVEKLREIQERGDKVLVFTVFHRMQTILAQVLRVAFGIDRNVVINGDAGSIKTAHDRIRLFSERPGFDVLVLSPRAAGTGLTITAANNVIHYGRWWNPAREDQATDRAYRIGQRRPVHVWIPVMHHPGDRTAGFDVRLEALMRAKRALASDFLMPVTSEVSDQEMRTVFATDKGAQ